jgi:glycerol-3-phosphate dehydrogenase
MDHLLHRYGSLLQELTDLCDERPELARPLPHAPAYIGAEIVYAASHEGALHLDDVMMHRTRLNYEQSDKGVGALEEIADLVAPVLGWDDATRRREIEAYVARAEAEDAAAAEPDDAAAERVRLRATDVAPLVPLGDEVDAGTKPGSPAGRGTSGPAGT